MNICNSSLRVQIRCFTRSSSIDPIIASFIITFTYAGRFSPAATLLHIYSTMMVRKNCSIRAWATLNRSFRNFELDFVIDMRTRDFHP